MFIRKLLSLEEVLTKQPVAVKGLMPFDVFGKIGSFNIAQFALQRFLKLFRKNRSALLFNLACTVIAGATVLLTSWNRRTDQT